MVLANNAKSHANTLRVRRALYFNQSMDAMNKFMSTNRYLKLSFLYLLVSFLIWLALDVIYILGGQNPDSWTLKFDVILPIIGLVGFFIITWKHQSKNGFMWRLFNSVAATTIYGILISILVILAGIQIHIALGGRL